MALVKAQDLYGDQDRVTEVVLSLAYLASGDNLLAKQTYDQVLARVDASKEIGDELEAFLEEAKRAFGS